MHPREYKPVKLNTANFIKMPNSEKILTAFIVLVVAVALISLAYTSKALFLTKENLNEDNELNHLSATGFTAFDVELAKKFMDKDNDGKCDVCGMDVELCIETGQLQCNMVSGSTIGILDSQHIHADWKVYINGIALDLSDKSHMERMRSNKPVSSFIHVDSGAPPPEKTGDIIHMHATGVPLWIFFESVGMKFDSNCIALENKEKFCNDNSKKLKFFVNGKESSEYENYVFKDNDKILISYGKEYQEGIKQQLASITDFSKNH